MGSDHSRVALVLSCELGFVHHLSLPKVLSNWFLTVELVYNSIFSMSVLWY